jgi:HD-like signal output (HDOD) protein
MIGQIDALPLIPGSIHLLRQAIATGNVGEENLARIIRLDPLMTARLLALANSESFGQAGQVYSLQQGIRLLGAEKACTLVSAAETVLLFQHWDHFDFQTFWTDALCCAQAASLLAKHLGMERQDDFFTAGLLHDIGRIALCEILPLHYAQTGIDASGTELLIQENEIVGMPHTLAGYELARLWHLPEEFAEGIRSHHFPEQAQNSSDFAAIVSIGNVMAERILKSAEMDDEALDDCRAAMRMLGLEEQALRTLFDEFSALLPSLFLDENDV